MKQKPLAPRKMEEQKLQKARVIVAKLLVSKIFFEWENRQHSNVMDLLYKYNDELSLGINPTAVLETMKREGLIHENGRYNDEVVYSAYKKTL
jgi:hypothetical protein